jgi:hypothetical protein
MLLKTDAVLKPVKQDLLDFTREFIQGPRLYQPSVDSIQAALKGSELKTPLQKNAEQYLNSMGIALIIDLFAPLGPGRVAITPVIDEEDAQKCLNLVCQQQYHQFRESLGIQFHWILKLSPHSHNELDHLTSKSMYWFFDNDGHPPECSIIDLQ